MDEQMISRILKNIVANGGTLLKEDLIDYKLSEYLHEDYILEIKSLIWWGLIREYPTDKSKLNIGITITKIGRIYFWVLPWYNKVITLMISVELGVLIGHFTK